MKSLKPLNKISTFTIKSNDPDTPTSSKVDHGITKEYESMFSTNKDEYSKEKCNYCGVDFNVEKNNLQIEKKQELVPKYSYTPMHKRSNSIVEVNKCINHVQNLIDNTIHKIHILKDTRNVYTVTNGGNVPELGMVANCWSAFLIKHNERRIALLDHNTNVNMQKNIIEQEEMILNEISSCICQFQISVRDKVAISFPYTQSATDMTGGLEFNIKELDAESLNKLNSMINLQKISDNKISAKDANKLSISFSIKNVDDRNENIEKCIYTEKVVLEKLNVLLDNLNNYRSVVSNLNKTYDNKLNNMFL